MSGRLDQESSTLDPQAVRALSELLGGDEDALAELAQALLDEAPQRLAELRGDDPALVGRAAHTLKANAATFGASELANRCRALEAAAREGDLSAREGLVERIEHEWPRVRDALVALCAGARP